jgi:hypothetical protein
MDNEFFFIIFVSWFLTNYIMLLLFNYNDDIDVILNEGYNKLNNLFFIVNDFLHIYNNIIFNNNLLDDYTDNENNENNVENKFIENEKKLSLKYEDKFLEDIRKMDKEFIFTDEENLLITKKYNEFYNSIMEKEYLKPREIINDKLNIIEILLKKYQEIDYDSLYSLCENNSESSLDSENNETEEIKEIKIKNLLESQSELFKEDTLLKEKYETNEFKKNISKNAELLSVNFVIDKRLEKIQNCNVIEFTPLGNVLMMYDKNKESFKFYSDSTIPYRYLEVVARKYVKQFSCRPIFVDMEDELKIAEETWDKQRQENLDKINDEKIKKEESIKTQKQVEVKKNVFTKFKSYNKEAGTGHVTTAAPPKNSISSKNLTVSHENEKILLKQKANRYTYEGKMANFSFLKKIDRKEIDKKFAITFSDFKKNIFKK